MGKVVGNECIRPSLESCFIMMRISGVYSKVFIILMWVSFSVSFSPIRIKYMMMEGHQFDDSSISDAFFVVLERSIDTIVNLISVEAGSDEGNLECYTGECGQVMWNGSKGGLHHATVDLFIQIRFKDQCSVGAAASARTCCRGKMDRPTAGIIWLCPSMINHVKLMPPKRLEMLLIHELIHVMGFNSQSLNYFRHPDGTPRVLRDSTGNPIGTELIKKHEKGSYLTTPSVQSFVREHFGCPTLKGALLDGGGKAYPVGRIFWGGGAPRGRGLWAFCVYLLCLPSIF